MLYCVRFLLMKKAMMSLNLALLNSEERQRIELDKQAAFLVWQIKQGRLLSEALIQHQSRLTTAQEQMWFQTSIEHYQHLMGIN